MDETLKPMNQRAHSDSSQQVKNNKEPKSDNVSFATGDLGVIQEIIFGDQIRANNIQLQQLREQVESNLEHLSNTLQDQISELSRSTTSSLEGLKSQLNSQREQSATSNELFRKELSTAKNSLTTSIADIATSSHNEHKTLERDLQARAATLNSLIDDCRKELTSLIDTHIKKLDAKKLDRGALSGMFTSVAAELNPGSADAAAEDALADNS